MDAEELANEVVSPPPLDALWHWFNAPLGRFAWPSDVDEPAQTFATSSDSSDAVPPATDADISHPPQGAKPTRQAALAANRRRAYRVKKKSELETLRATSAALSSRLAELVAKSEALKGRLAQPGSAGRFATGWRGIALRQLQRRLEAEALNRELRVLVRQHRDVGQTLASALQSEAAVEVSKQCDALHISTPRRPDKSIYLLESDIRTAAELLRQVDATYNQAFDVLNNCQAAPATEEAYSSRQSWRRDPLTEREFFELVETWTIPFSLEDAVPAMHRALPILLAKECRPAFIQVPNPTTTMAIKFEFSCSDNGQRPTRFQSVLVARTIAEKDHAVFSWRSLTVEMASPSGEIVESGWGVAERGRSASGRQDQPAGTVTKFCTRFEMRGDTMKAEGGQERDKRLDKYVRSVFSAAQDDVNEWYQVIEGLVMKDLSALSIG